MKQYLIRYQKNNKTGIVFVMRESVQDALNEWKKVEKQTGRSVPIIGIYEKVY